MKDKLKFNNIDFLIWRFIKKNFNFRREMCEVYKRLPKKNDQERDNKHRSHKKTGDEEVGKMKVNVSKISLIMAQKQLKSQDVAQMGGISRQALSVIRAKGTCTEISLSKIAKGLGVEVEEIIVKEE